MPRRKTCMPVSHYVREAAEKPKPGQCPNCWRVALLVDRDVPELGGLPLSHCRACAWDNYEAQAQALLSRGHDHESDNAEG